jgi:GT2 family glycosyltransferase
MPRGMARPEAGAGAEFAASRRRLLAAIGAPPDLTFLRGVGNLGDELIYAGTRRLLAAVPHREAALDELPRLRGHTLVMAGGGAWCRPFHELMPHLLPLAELRFERVIVLPSSFDLSVALVRDALSRTGALVFARERESLRQIQGVCAADLAHDCACFFDYSPYHRTGHGTLSAFRTDREALSPAPLPAGNVDISVCCSSLDEWLWTIARHATVRTDRAHVMIAAALLGKRVEYRPSSYHKVPAIAEHALGAFDVHPLGPLGAAPPAAGAAASRPAARLPLAAAAPRAMPPPAAATVHTTRPAAVASAPAPPPIQEPRAPAAIPSPPAEQGCAVPASVPDPAAAEPAAAVRQRLLAQARHNLDRLPPAPLAGGGAPRLTVVVLTLDRPGRWPWLLRSLRDHVRLPFELLLVDDGSVPEARAELRRLCAAVFPDIAGPATDAPGELAPAADAPGELAPAVGSDDGPLPAGPAPASCRRVETIWLDRRHGCAAARQLAAERASTEYLLLLDDDAEVFPGTVEHLVQALDGNPAALAAGAHMVLPDGATQICGGAYHEETGGELRLEPLGQGADFAAGATGPPRPCQWLAGGVLALRRSALLRDPFDLGMSAYYEDIEWFYRLGRSRPAAQFLCVPAALALHHQELKGPRGAPAEAVFRSLAFLAAIAHFYRVHGLVLDGVFVFAPRLAVAGHRDTAAARLLLELVLARGTDWLAQEWIGGGLAPLFHGQGDAPDAADGAAPGSVPAALALARQELAAAREELRVHRHELTVARAELVRAHQDHAAVHQTRLWRLAERYWRLRRTTARWLGRYRTG